MIQIKNATFEIFVYIHAYSEKCKKLTQLWEESCYDATFPSCKSLAISVWADTEVCDDLGKPAAPRGPVVGDVLLGTARVAVGLAAPTPWATGTRPVLPKLWVQLFSAHFILSNSGPM